VARPRRKNQRAQQLEIDLDMRLANLWADIVEMFEEDSLEAVGAYIRAAYGAGYCDALREARDGEPEKLLVEHGYRLMP
jgi:hypothetical protein